MRYNGMEPKLVITAMSSISSLGKSAADIVASLSSPPKTGMVQDFGFHKLAHPQPCFCIADFDPEAILGKKGLRTKDRATKLLLAAVELGCKDIFETTPKDARPGICIGTSFGSVQSIGDFLSDAFVNGANNVNPMAFANTVINSPASNVNIRHASRMSSSTVATTFNAGIDALIYACTYIRAGHAASMVVGGLEELSFYGIAGLAKSKVLSTSGVMMPFGRDSDGFLPGEGCAIFYIESEESAVGRKAPVIAELAGMCSCFEPGQGPLGFHTGSDGARHAMKQACRDAGIDASAVDFIAASANGSPSGDAMEAAAIGELFPNTPVAAYKAKTGECYGASSMLSMACAISDMKNARISGVGVRYPRRGDCNLAADTINNRPSRFALVNSFSCDGFCASLVLKNRV
jgi:3-oxoacyl-[acyl-carrier-protein] synthase II